MDQPPAGGWDPQRPRVDRGPLSAAPEASEVVAALHKVGIDDVDGSSRRRAEYSSDASLYRVPPTVVVFPRDTDELVGALETAHRLGVPVTARGAGTSVAGNAVGTGIVLDVSRHLDTIHTVDAESRTATVEPGVVLDDLQRRAARSGLRFGPDPSTHDRCTIGGMIGNNACGSRALGYGRTADNVIALDFLAGSGARLEAKGLRSRGSPLLEQVRWVRDTHAIAIREELGRFGRQISGYSLEHLLPEHGEHLARALVGTEGTCGLVLGATLRLMPTPPATALIVLGYPDMVASAEAVPTLLAHDPVAIEGLDTRIIDAVRSRKGDAAVPALTAGAAWLYVELAGESSPALRHSAAALVKDAGAIDSLIVEDAGLTRQLWQIREEGAAFSSRSPVGDPAYPGWEDAAVPPAALGSYLREFEALLAQYGLSGMPYGHFGDGCVHVRLDARLDEQQGVKTYRAFLQDAARLVAAHGGSMSGEHGDGRARSELLPLMYSEDILQCFERFKGAFDPDDLCNPGVVVRPRPVDADVRPTVGLPVRPRAAFELSDDRGSFSQAVHRCIGVGKCLADKTADGGVMCPSYLATGDEKDTTRGRARVLQEMVRGSFREQWRAPEVHEALDLCLSCKGCASDCPAGVDMATYKAEVLHRTYRRRVRPASHYSLGWLPRWARLARLAPRAANALLRWRPTATIGKRLAGIDARRGLPAFSEQRFREWFAARPCGPDDAPAVLLWVDTFTEHFSPAVGIATVRVLEAAGFRVTLSPEPECCGLTWISTGQLDAARRILTRTVQSLRPAVREGIPIVGMEPSCIAVLRSDAAELLGADSGAVEVAAATHTLAELLDRTGRTSAIPRLDGVEVLAQPHCHHHAVMGWDSDRALLWRAGASVRTVGGCCGLAGNFGVERGHYDLSVAVAETALLPAVRAAGPEVRVLADGFSCRTQLAELAGVDSLHLAELLAPAVAEG